MPTEEQRRLAKLSKVVIELFPKIFHIILIHIAPLTEYMCRLFRGNSQLKSQLHENEVLVIQELNEITGYSKFSLQLSYTFFMTFWGIEPTNIENNLANDIKQIRILANEIISNIDSAVNESMYNKFISRIQQITESIESYLHLEPHVLFDVCQLEITDDLIVMNLIKTLRSHQKIEVSIKQKNEIKQKERENFYRTSTLLVDYANESLTGLLSHHITNSSFNLLQFIQHNQHAIYHLCYNKPCCRDPSGCIVFKHTKPILNSAQLDILLDTTTKLPGHKSISRTKHCCCPANPNINYEDLDLSLTRCLLINLLNMIPDASPERLAVDNLIKFRNKAYGHAAKGAISNYDYPIYKAQIEQSIMILAKAQGREAEFKQKLNDAAVRPLDETIMRQYQTMMANVEIIQTIKNIEYAVAAKSLPDCISKDLSDVTVTEGRDAHFEIWTKAEGLCAVWTKNGSEMENSKFKSARFGIIHSLYIMNTCLLDKGLYTVTVNNIERHACLHIEEYFTMNPQSRECTEGEKVQFICEVVEDGLPACWNRNGKNLENGEKYEILQVGKVHRLSILQCDLHDAGDYTVNVNNRVRTTSLNVKEYFTMNPQSMECTEGENVQFLCEVVDDGLPACWNRHGKNLENGEKYEILQVGKVHRLSILHCDLHDAGDYTVNVNNRVRTSSLNVKEVPPAIGQLSEEDKSLYLEIIKSGTETRYSMRIPIIGEKGVGKTSLLRRLLGDSIEDVESTDGVDIVHRCKIRLNDGKWVVDKDTDKRKDIIRRIHQAVNESKEQNRTGMPRSHKDSCSSISDSSQVGGNDISENEPNRPDTSTVDVIKKVDTKSTEDQRHVIESPTSNMDDEIEENGEPPASVEDQFRQSTPLSHSNQLQMADEKPESKLNKALSEKILHELSEFINDIEKCEVTEEVLVGCGFWDFAGEKHYYPTHPIFLNPYALHLLVVDIMKDIKQISTENGYDKIGEYIDFWFDSIHSCGASDSTVDSTGDYLNPPVILVCTHIDKCQTELDEKKSQFSKQLNSLLHTEEKLKHLRSICYVSNINPTKSDFDHLRRTIFKFAKKMKHFREQIPLRWIRLEQSLDIVQGAGVNTLSWSDITQLASSCSIDDANEINLFLKYQHNVGNIIYFESLKEFIILNPKWLADAFRCFVSDKYADDVKLMSEWRILVDTGELTSPLIKKLFKKDSKYEFYKHDLYLLKVMEIFGIVVKPKTLMENGQERNLQTYFMPCMISENSSIMKLYDLFGVKSSGCVLTPWLCIEFYFMPFDFFNHIFSHYCRQYPICVEAESRRNAIYHGMGVFFYDNTKQRKFVLCFSKNTIAIQMWQWKQLEQGKFKTKLEELMSVVHNVKYKYEPRSVSFSVKVKCAYGSLHIAAGRQSYKELKDLGDYFCEEHNEVHDTKEIFQTWFKDYSEVVEKESPWKKFKEGVNQRFNQKCHGCGKEPPVCWCHDCQKSTCNDCHNNRRDSDNSRHILQHVDDMYALDSKFKVNVSLIIDLKVFHNGLLVIADWTGKQLVTRHITRPEQYTIALPGDPYRMAVVDNNTVAVTLAVKSIIVIVDVRERQVLKHIEAKADAGAIMFRNGQLFLGLDKAIKIIDMSGEVKRTMPVGHVTKYICGGEAGTIFYTDMDKFYCIDSEGNTLFTFTDPNMNGPRVITPDHKGHLLVTCERSANLFRISPDGKKGHVIITQIPMSSWSPYMCYDPVSESVVIGLDKTVYVYKKL